MYSQALTQEIYNLHVRSKIRVLSIRNEGNQFCWCIWNMQA